MRGTPTRLPYWPQASRPIDLPPSRRSLVSWSLSNDSATATRAPPGHSRGRSRRPARTRPTSLRQCSSGHCHGSRSDSGRFMVALRSEILHPGPQLDFPRPGAAVLAVEVEIALGDRVGIEEPVGAALVGARVAMLGDAAVD